MYNGQAPYARVAELVYVTHPLNRYIKILLVSE